MRSLREFQRQARLIIEPDHARKNSRPIPTGAVELHFLTEKSRHAWDEMMSLVCDDEDTIKHIDQLRDMFDFARIRLIGHLINDYEMDVHEYARREVEYLHKVDFELFLHSTNIVQHDSNAHRLLRDDVFLLPQFYGIWGRPDISVDKQIRHLQEINCRRKAVVFVQYLGLQSLKGDDDPYEIIERLGIEAKFPDPSTMTYLWDYLKELKRWERKGPKAHQSIEVFIKHIKEDIARRSSEEIRDILTKRPEYLKYFRPRSIDFQYKHLQAERVGRECAARVEKVVVPQANEKLRRRAEGVERGPNEKLRRLAKWWRKQGVMARFLQPK